MVLFFSRDRKCLQANSWGSHQRLGSRRWTVVGANAMITLRCAFANGEENVFYEKQHQDNVLKLERLMKVPIMKPALPRAA